MTRRRIVGVAVVVLALCGVALIVHAVARKTTSLALPTQGQAVPGTGTPAAEDEAGLSNDIAHAESQPPVPVGLPKPTKRRSSVSTACT